MLFISVDQVVLEGSNVLSVSRILWQAFFDKVDLYKKFYNLALLEDTFVTDNFTEITNEMYEQLSEIQFQYCHFNPSRDLMTEYDIRKLLCN